MCSRCSENAAVCSDPEVFSCVFHVSLIDGARKRGSGRAMLKATMSKKGQIYTPWDYLNRPRAGMFLEVNAPAT